MHQNFYFEVFGATMSRCILKAKESVFYKGVSKRDVVIFEVSCGSERTSALIYRK